MPTLLHASAWSKMDSGIDVLTPAARSDQPQAVQDGLDCRCSPPGAWDSSASSLPVWSQDREGSVQVAKPESVQHTCSQRPRAASIRLDEGDDEYDNSLNDCGDSDNDGPAEYNTSFKCSAQGDAESEPETPREDDALTTALGRGFARKRTKHDEACDSCDRCKSNLNGKLIVRCASCSFRRHLYCFTPPLKQHPAFLEQVHVTALGTKVRVRPTTDTIANWSCDDCRQRGHSSRLPQEECDSQSREHTHSRRTPTKKRAHRQRTGHDIHRQKATSLSNTLEMSSHPARSDHKTNKTLSSVQAQWHLDGNHRFDWSAFRAEKIKRIALQIDTEEASPDELVYYSKPFADMKKTVLGWMRSVAEQKRTESNRRQRETKKRPPPKRDIMHRLTDAEQEKLERTLMHQQLDADDEQGLFDDSLTYRFDISASKIRRLREARISVIQTSSVVAADDSVDVVEVLEEFVEAVCMDDEDVDAQVPQVSTFTESALDTAQVQWAAVVIQSAVIRRAYKAKQRIHTQHHQTALEEERRIREVAARASIRVLRLCVRFVMLSVKNLRNAQAKKLLLQTLQEASEDTKVATSAEDDAEKRRKLAKKRIQRFFLQRVRRYIHLKKRMMSRRIRLWWKRKHALWKWRDAAGALRDRWRSRASRVIQAAYRRYHTKKVFQGILEKHALRKIKLFLRSWLMSRVIKKEKARAEIYAITASIGVISEESLSELAPATVDKILRALGMGLYTAGDFWNAASVLDRACKLNSPSFDLEARLALAYSHHRVWYASYDSYNLQNAYEMYCIALDDFSQRAKKTGMSEVDPFILQDTAIVMMQLENFGGSLRLLAQLIQFFVQDESFTLWLLLAAVQLQQRGEWEQSVEYLTYLQDMPPSPYLERDILCLCAIGLERQRRDTRTRTASREAWSAALRQWSLERKTKHVVQNKNVGSNLWSQPSDDAVAFKRSPHKWEMLSDFAQRAIIQGHYLLACRLMLHMLEIRPEDDGDTDRDRSERAAVWWNLADVFRHLGHIDLYVDATRRSHQCVEAAVQDSIIDDADKVTEWRREAEAQARSFRDVAEKTPTIEFMRKLRMQYAQRESAYQ